MTAAPDRQILIGVHVTGAGEGPAPPLSSVFENTPLPLRLPVLPDRAAASRAPGGLELLLAALDSDASHGLAGPSTNRGWNEQAVAPNCGSTQEALWDQADALLARYGNAWVPLSPLHSLADFCYVVKNEVVAAIGAADTAYTQGPCWEMDYNVRAARAGFLGVWVQGAFVHRAPRCAVLA